MKVHFLNGPLEFVQDEIEYEFFVRKLKVFVMIRNTYINPQGKTFVRFEKLNLIRQWTLWGNFKGAVLLFDWFQSFSIVVVQCSITKANQFFFIYAVKRNNSLCWKQMAAQNLNGFKVFSRHFKWLFIIFLHNLCIIQ